MSWFVLYSGCEFLRQLCYVFHKSAGALLSRLISAGVENNQLHYHSVLKALLLHIRGYSSPSLSQNSLHPISCCCSFNAARDREPGYDAPCCAFPESIESAKGSYTNGVSSGKKMAKRLVTSQALWRRRSVSVQLSGRFGKTNNGFIARRLRLVCICPLLFFC